MGFSPDADRFYALDPNPWYAEANLSPELRVAEYLWDDLNDNWSRQVWWTKLLLMANEMIVYTPVEVEV